jgi:POT family proton-dependent oligopeptide transporter
MSNPPQSSRHPAGLWVLFTTELWERFAFYAMRAILVLYLIAEADKQGNPGFGWSEADAYMLYGWYTSLVYVAPMFGGWMADTFLGQRRAVIIGAILMAIGEFFLFATEAIRIGDGTPITFATDPMALLTFYGGLGLMILGNGFFKPCISVMVGQLYKPGDRRRDSAFSIFYMGINIGAAISPILAGLLAAKFGFQWGFFSAGVGMCIGLTIQLAFSPIFLKGIGTPTKPQEGVELTPEEKEEQEKKIYEQTRPLVKQDWDRMFVITVLSLFVIAFWLTFEQAGSSLNVFAEKNTDRIVPSVIANLTVSTDKDTSKQDSWLFTNAKEERTDKDIILNPCDLSERYVFPAAWYQSVNAIGIVIFAPIFTLIWNFLYRRGIEPSTPVKFALGILLVSCSFFVMIPGAIQAAQTGGNAAAYWLVACYLFATWGELCLSPVGLSMVTKLAPARYASIFMGIWFLASAAAYWLAGYCAAVFAAGEGVSILFGKECGLADFFLLLAIIPAVIGLIALMLAPMLKKRMHGID